MDFNRTEKTAYEEFKREIGSATVQQICRKNAESWKSFFTLLRKKRNGELSNWLKPKPSNYLNQFKGRIHLKGRQGQLEITYDEVKRKWYAHVSFTVKGKLISGVG